MTPRIPSGTLIFAQLCKPAIAPVLGALRLPKDGAAALPPGVRNVLDNIATKLAFRNSLDLVEWKMLTQQPFKFQLLHFALKLPRSALRRSSSIWRGVE